ncbi:Glucagon receptor-like protein [Aix galericulata]|nr:Glucagon receptor-like protein [Aix galericulata]
MCVARRGQSRGGPVGVSRGYVPRCPCREPWFYRGEGGWGPWQPEGSLCCFVPAVKHGLVSRRCGVDGQWVTVNGSQPWRDYSQCEEEMESTMEEVGAVTGAGGTPGRAAGAAQPGSAERCLCAGGCPQADGPAEPRGKHGRGGDTEHGGTLTLGRACGWVPVPTQPTYPAALGCRAAQVLMQYCILANHYWFLVEAVYLYKLLIGAVFSEKNYYRLYLYLGWGTPVVFVVPWMAAKYLKENAECWALNENMAYWWIIRIPILLASLINLLIFMRILKVILAKLRANQKGYADYKLRLAKATLTLIPLFGIHEVVFIFATDEQTTGILRYVKVFFTLFLNSFQVRREHSGGPHTTGLCDSASRVARSGEGTKRQTLSLPPYQVKSEMKKKWQLWKLDHPALCCTQ